MLADGQLLEPAQVVGEMPGQLPVAANGKILVECRNQRYGHEETPEGKSLMIGQEPAADTVRCVPILAMNTAAVTRTASNGYTATGALIAGCDM
ncbi:hypothetical protein GCM10009126_24870 [Rhodanobacter caeni]|uniref:Uncharacterized protein n=1 Tax=Rhodanobacter caeni TaxID=657654 RepID=A0ABN0UQV6_9GAMM